MQLTEYITHTRALFDQSDLHFGHGTDNALDEAVYLVYAFLNLDFATSPDAANRVLTDTELTALNALVQRRLVAREPVAYLVGEAWFAGHQFHADARALIPRSPIAELIECGFEPLIPREPAQILDMCTGGGCIGIACALQFTAATVDLVDLSAASLALARKNIARHSVGNRVRTIQSNLFDKLDRRYDLIVANPPYVSAAEMAALPPEYHHEPASGLECDDDGLALPLTILREAEHYLNSHGLLVLELGNAAERLQKRLGDVPLLWLEFAYGGSGVMAITAAELKQHHHLLDPSLPP